MYVGKLYQKEVDFAALRGSEKLYSQVNGDISHGTTFKREVGLLLPSKAPVSKKILVPPNLQPAAQKVQLFLSVLLIFPASEVKSFLYPFQYAILNNNEVEKAALVPALPPGRRNDPLHKFFYPRFPR